MLWKTHIRIIREVLNRIGISPSSPEASRMREGVITPDKRKDFPHHHGKEQAKEAEKAMNSVEVHLRKQEKENKGEA